MTRRMRIDDLTDLAVPSQPALSPDGTRVVYVLRTLDGEGDRNVDQLWTVPAAGGTPRRLTSRPAPTPRRPGRRTAPGSRSSARARCTCSPPTAASPSRSPTCRSAPVRRCGARTATGSRSAAAGRPDRRHAAPLVTKRRRLPGRRRRHVRRDRATSCTWSTSRPATCRQVTDGDARRPARLVAGRPHRRLHPQGRRRQRPHLPHRRAPARRRRPQGRAAGRRASRTASPAPSRSAADGAEPAGRRPPGDLRLGHAAPAAGPARRRRAGRPHRPPRPQRDARRPGVPRRAARSRPPTAGCCSASATAAAPTSGTRTARSSPATGRVVSGLSVAGGTAVVALATPTSYGEIVALDLASGAETVLTDHGAGLADVDAVRPRGAHVHDLRRHRGAGLAGPRPRARRARCRCCSTCTAARTTRGTPPPTRCTSTTRSSPRRAGRCCWSTRAAATATARRSTTACRARGASPTPTTSSSRSTRWSPRASPTRTGSRSPATATAAS